MSAAQKKGVTLPLEERVRELQRRLGVDDDGIIGPVTLTRIESILGSGGGASPSPDAYSLEVSLLGLNQIVEFEVTSEKHYEKRLRRPTWPGGNSGVTIGIGYDLGQNAKATIRDDWSGQIPDADLDELLGAAGVTGQAAQSLVGQLNHIIIPFKSASEVFHCRTLPRFARQTRKAYPGVEALPADAEGMLLSLVYNRGPKMTGPTRTEMKAIQPLVQAGDLQGIAVQLRSMKRLWDIKVLPGLHARRDREAELIEHARRTYPPEELVRI
jgi:hypothetical protein